MINFGGGGRWFFFILQGGQFLNNFQKPSWSIVVGEQTANVLDKKKVKCEECKEWGGGDGQWGRQ